MTLASSTTSALLHFLEISRIKDSSTGFANLAFNTAADTPSLLKIANASKEGYSMLPKAIIAKSFPSSRSTPLPYSIGEHALFLLLSMADERGYLKAQGPSMFKAKSNMETSSSSSIGAMTVIPGMLLKNATSRFPWCVGPSSPTSPALSTAKTT